MALRYLLDTNTASYVIKGHPSSVRAHLADIPVAEVAISVITEAELRFGVHKFPKAMRLRHIVEEFLRFVEIRSWDSAAAGAYADIRAALEQQGRPMGNLDTMIAAHALALGLVLVTRDHVFSRVKGLQVEDWSRS
jgi:tRNA(fMet)-specific endonuclease VapC